MIVMDNARFHKSEETREIIEDHGHQLLFLPPYSPDLNPIENYWAILKGKLRKIVANFQNLFDALTAVFQTIYKLFDYNVLFETMAFKVDHAGSHGAMR